MTNPNDDKLDDLFAAARDTAPVPSDDLMARVLADAAAVQPESGKASAPQSGFWASLLDTIGGWPAASGLAAATVAGIWVGVAPPSSVEDLTASLIGDEVSITLFSAEHLLDEGALSDG